MDDDSRSVPRLNDSGDGGGAAALEVEDAQVQPMLAAIEVKTRALIAKQMRDRKTKQDRLRMAKKHASTVARLQAQLQGIEDDDAFKTVTSELKVANTEVQKELDDVVAPQVNVGLSPEFVNSPMFQRARAILELHELACRSVKVTPEEICFLNAGILYPVIRAILEIQIPLHDPQNPRPLDETDAGGVIPLVANRSLAILVNLNGFAIMLRETMAISEKIDRVSDVDIDRSVDIFLDLALEYEQAISELNIVCVCAVRSILVKDGLCQRIVDIFVHIPELVCQYGPRVLSFAGRATVGFLTVEALMPGALAPFTVLLEMGAEAVPLVVRFARSRPLYYAIVCSHFIVNSRDYVALLTEQAVSVKDFVLRSIPESLLNPARQVVQVAPADAAAAGGGGGAGAAAAADAAAPVDAAGLESRVNLFHPDSFLGQLESGLFLLCDRVTDTVRKTVGLATNPPLVTVLRSASSTLREGITGLLTRLYVFRNDVCAVQGSNPQSLFDVKPEFLKLLTSMFEEGNIVRFPREVGLIAHALGFQCQALVVSVVALSDAFDVRTGNVTVYRVEHETINDSGYAVVGSQSASVKARQDLEEALGEFNGLLYVPESGNPNETIGVTPNARPGIIPQDNMSSLRRWIRIAGRLAPEDTRARSLEAGSGIYANTKDAKAVEEILLDEQTPPNIKAAIRKFQQYLIEENDLKSPPPQPDKPVERWAPDRPIVELAKMSWSALTNSAGILIACANALRPVCGVQPGGESVDRVD